MSSKFTFSTFIILTLGLTIIVLVIFIDTEPESELFLCNGRPCSVILIIPETLSARHMGIYGYERDTTPFIDEFFSEESLVFENAWSNAPWTIPSFASIFTSQMASDVFVEGLTDKLSDSVISFIDVLTANSILKLVVHNWALPSSSNENRGFFNARFKPEERFQGEDPLLFIKATDWIEEQVQKESEQPFFLLLQPYAPHSPYHPPEPYRHFFGAPLEYPGPVTPREQREAREVFWEGGDVELATLERFRLQYDQEIRYLDSEFKSFISRIPEEVQRNTVFIFISDHGEAFGQHNNIAHGRTLYEEEIHIPFLIRVPGIEQKRIHEPITLLDTGSTILEIFDLDIPETFQGVSLLPAFRGEELQLAARIVRAESVSDIHPLEGDWSEIGPAVRTEPLLYPRDIAVRKGDWKLLRLGDGSLELYNLERDYYEQNNLIPWWHDLYLDDRAEILPLFEALGESPPL